MAYGQKQDRAFRQKRDGGGNRKDADHPDAGFAPVYKETETEAVLWSSAGGQRIFFGNEQSPGRYGYRLGRANYMGGAER